MRIKLTGDLFDFTTHPDQKNLSNWVDWTSFASIVDKDGAELPMDDLSALPGLSVRLVCTPAGKIYLSLQYGP